MVYVVYIIKILLYFSIILSLFLCTKKAAKKGKRLSLISILFFSVLMGVYSILVGNPNLSSDRASYFTRFESGDRVSGDTMGLDYLFNALLRFSSSADWLWFSFEFIFIFLTLLVYRANKMSSPRALLLLMLSNYPVFGFYALKQSICNAFSIMSLTIYFNRDGLSKSERDGRITAIIMECVCVFVAVAFHEAGLVLVPIFVALYLWRSRSVQKLGYVFLFFAVILFPVLQSLLFNYAVSGPEDVSAQLESYSEGGGVAKSFLTVIKGLHFYIITLIGFKYRRYLRPRVVSFDKYLLLSCIASASVLVSGYMYWYFRFSLLVSFFVFIFAAEMYKNLREMRGPTKWFETLYAILFLLTLKDLVQYYFIYGGI